jgi:hypothetical protein
VSSDTDASMQSTGVKSARYLVTRYMRPQSDKPMLVAGHQWPLIGWFQVCDTAGYCACAADRGSHAMVPIIPNKACCMSGTSDR